MGSWDWYHIKSWDVSKDKGYFAFKAIEPRERDPVTYKFNTKEV